MTGVPRRQNYIVDLTVPDNGRFLKCRRSPEIPEICRFLGIVIYMLYDDHRPPHFHAEYGEYKITVEINTGVIQGRFPRRALKALLEWYELHRDDLLEDWELAEQHQPLNRIPPLE
jgi:hypothetical protein